MSDDIRPLNRVLSPIRQRSIPRIKCDNCGQLIVKGERVVTQFTTPEVAGPDIITHCHEYCA